MFLERVGRHRQKVNSLFSLGDPVLLCRSSVHLRNMYFLGHLCLGAKDAIVNISGREGGAREGGRGSPSERGRSDQGVGVTLAEADLDTVLNKRTPE